jgi:hypothetical protein
MSLRKLLNLSISQSGKIHLFSRNDPVRDCRMTLLQVFQEKICCVARSGPVSDDDDLIRVRQIFRDFFVEGKLLGNTLSLVVGFFTVDQVALKSKGIVWSDGCFVFRPGIIHVLVKTRGLMIDDRNYSLEPLGATRRLLKSGFAQKLAKTGDLFHFKVVGMRTLKECALRAYHKCEFVVSVRLDFTYLSNQFNNIAPGQITRKFAIEQASQQNLQAVTHMSVHSVRLSLRPS